MPRKRIDCLLIYAPKDEGESAYGMIMPMGLFALADLLSRKGYTSKIIHTGIEKIKDNSFSIEDYLKDKKIGLIGISLHWYFQSFDAMRLIDKIRRFRPETKILLGGFTASFFSEEILKYSRNTDFVIRGDAELPLLDLMRELFRKGPDFSRVPNLVWRKGDEIIKNAQTYTASSRYLDKLNFTNFYLMEGFSIYKKVGLSEIHYFYNPKTLSNNGGFPICVGRGCRMNCSFCGGSRLSQKFINNREGIAFRSAKNVLKSIKDAVGAGFKEVFICFDPGKKYFRELFSLIRKSKIRVRMNFNCQALPGNDFIDDFKKTLKEGSVINLSPESGSERLRRINKGIFYTNNRLIKVLEYLKKKSVCAIIYFCYPLPFSTKKDILATERLVRLIKRRFAGSHRVVMHAISPDPGSPMFIYPEKFKIVKKFNSFSDYCTPKEGLAYFPESADEADFNVMFKDWSDRENVVHRIIPEGFAYARLQEYDDALRKADEALKLAPGEIEGYLLSAYVYRQKKEYPQAIENVKKAGRISPRDIRINFLLSRYYKDAGQLKRSAREISGACAKLGGFIE